ncbi:MAG: hypothetical protein HY783_03580 [Chloroflexi bacterium]|nr:hypothetical protein [Chloroflexota bacterium]
MPEQPGGAVADDEVIAANPKFIVVAWAGVAHPTLGRVARRPGWDQVSAVREACVVAVDEIWLNAPGPNLARGARLLAAVIHPEVFTTDGE